LGRSAQENQPIKSNPSGAFKKISEGKNMLFGCFFHFSSIEIALQKNTVGT